MNNKKLKNSKVKEEKIYSLDPSKIYVSGNRQRQIFNPREMAKLINSTKDLGQLQPGICYLNPIGKRIELVFGERRLRACEEIGIPFKFVLKEDVKDPLLLERMELEENLIRVDLHWKEEVRAKKRIFDILKASDSRQTIETVGNYLCVGKGTLSEDISLAIWIEENEEVAAAPNKTTAKKIAERLFRVVERDEALEESFEKAKKAAEPQFDKKEIQKLLDEYNVKHPDEPLEEKEFIERKNLLPDQETNFNLSFQEERILDYDKRCMLGDMEDIILEFPDKYFDLVFFDPPWGVEYDKSQKGAEYQKKYEDSKLEFLMKFPERLQLLNSKMAENSHLYIFFGIVNHNFIYDCIEAAGFKTSRIPLLWHKRGACRTRAPEWEYGRSYEAIAFARKGLKKLQGSPIADIITTPQPTPKIKDIHPSAKHPEIYHILLSKSAYPGDKVLDPMGGSGMMGVAADELKVKLNLDWYQIEIDKDYRNLQLFNLSKGYHEFVTPIINIKSSGAETETDFHKLEIGSEQWRAFWQANPKQQDEMLEWKTKLSIREQE